MSDKEIDLTPRGMAWQEADQLIRECIAQAGLSWGNPKPMTVNILHRVANAAHRAGFSLVLERLSCAPELDDFTSAERCRCERSKELRAQMEAAGDFESEEFGFAQQLVDQYGGEHIDDNAEVYKIHVKDLYVIMKMLGYSRAPVAAESLSYGDLVKVEDGKVSKVIPNDELPGMWDISDFIGGETNTQRPAAQEVAAKAIDWHAVTLSLDEAHDESLDGRHGVARAMLREVCANIRASLPAPQQAEPDREAREAEQRARMQARLATRHEGKATADFDLPAPNDAPQQATPEPVGEPVCEVIADFSGQSVEYRIGRLFPGIEALGNGAHTVYTSPAPGVPEAWDEGYRQGVEDERTSDANIGIAGFGAKVSPARQNPYRAAAQAKGGEHA